ncbi:zinc-binding alcohol dehydrogenase family protein [Actinomadura nitritigenes]|uniref:zinc-binding alcohol dehydrogenase family protein n=1 Tax=Actinomadura nitritigenes TaxID=134602 RepID=UPI003D911515
MLAAVTTAPKQMEIRDVPEPEPGPGQALIRVETAGLCGSDYHLYSGDHPYAHFPQIQGHEFAGIVEATGPGYTGPAAIGDRVAIEPLIACGHCFACRRGRYNCCSTLQVMGAHTAGALREKVAVAGSALHPVPGLDAATAALVEPVSIGLQAVIRAAVAAEDTVLVLGAGPIGQAVSLAAADRGAEVMITDLVDGRLEIARRLGARHCVAGTGGPADAAALAGAVRDWTAGEGAAVVVDATGSPALVRQAFDLVAHSGTIVIVGISQREAAIPVSEFTRKEVSVLGSRNNAGVFGAAADLVTRHAASVRTLITHTYPLERAPEAIEYAMNHPRLVEKAVINIGGDACE